MTKTHSLSSTWDHPWDPYCKDVHLPEIAVSASCPFLPPKPSVTPSTLVVYGKWVRWRSQMLSWSNAVTTIPYIPPIPTPPLHRIKPCGGSIFPSCGPSCSSSIDEPRLVDSLCGPRLVDWLAVMQVGLTGVGVDGHYHQTRMLLLSGPIFCTRVCWTPGGKPRAREGSFGSRFRKDQGERGWLLEAWPPEGLLSQEMWSGPWSWGPAKVNGSSLLHQAEPVRVILGQTQFRHVQTNMDSLSLKSYPGGILS